MARFAYLLNDSNKIAESLVERVVVPNGMTLQAGDVVLAETLASGSTVIYTAANLTDITTQFPCIVIDQKFYESANGQRPEGQNILDITFKEGDVITVLRLQKHMKLAIAADALDNTGVIAPAAGKFLIPQNNDRQLATANAAGTAVTALVVEAVTSTPIGGNLGIGFASTVVARVVLA